MLQLVLVSIGTAITTTANNNCYTSTILYDHNILKSTITVTNNNAHNNALNNNNIKNNNHLMTRLITDSSVALINEYTKFCMSLT